MTAYKGALECWSDKSITVMSTQYLFSKRSTMYDFSSVLGPKETQRQAYESMRIPVNM